MWRLPPRIRPSVFAFGTLADGYLPFDVEGGEEAEVWACYSRLPLLLLVMSEKQLLSSHHVWKAGAVLIGWRAG